MDEIVSIDQLIPALSRAVNDNLKNALMFYEKEVISGEEFRNYIKGRIEDSDNKRKITVDKFWNKLSDEDKKKHLSK